MSIKPEKHSQYLVLGLVLLTVWLRYWQLDIIPPGLWFDESFNAMAAVWMTETNTLPIFIPIGQGREVLFHYLLLFSISTFGQSVFSIRIVPAMLAVLSACLMYRWSSTLFTGEPQKKWIALLSTAGLTVSFGFLVMSRIGYRANALLPLILSTNFFFWQAWQTGKSRYYILAGISLALCQYTYLAGRLFPLVFIIFTLLRSIPFRKRFYAGREWVGLVLMLGVGVIGIAPMLAYFWDNPNVVLERTGDVALELDNNSEVTKTFGIHLFDAIRVFWDGEDPNWRHHLIGRPVFNWFSTLGFIAGLIIVAKNHRIPRNLFLLILLVVMWLPAPLSEPAFHTLRLIGILPAYYAIMSVGLITGAIWINKQIHISLTKSQVGFVVLAALILISGGINTYDYFYRWAIKEEVYDAFDGEVVDLGHYFRDQPPSTDLIIPFYLYKHATIRYLLHNHYNEKVLLDDDRYLMLNERQQTKILIPEYPPDDGKPPAYVWLVKDGLGDGTAYVSNIDRYMTLDDMKSSTETIVENRTGNIIARQYDIGTDDVLPLFPREMPEKKVAYNFDEKLELVGYEFTLKGQNLISLSLAWHILGYEGIKDTLFIQLLDSKGNSVGQYEIEPIYDKMYRWRKEALLLEEHRLRVETPLEDGIYFARLGYFDPETGDRLQVYSVAQKDLRDEVIIGPFFVGDNESEVFVPHHKMKAKFDNNFELLGYSTHKVEETPSTIKITLFWKAIEPVDKNFTVFLQVLDEQDNVIAQSDAQPLNGLYPTSKWKEGDIIIDEFDLPISYDRLHSQNNRLITGMYDLATGYRLPTYNAYNELLSDGTIQLLP